MEAERKLPADRPVLREYAHPTSMLFAGAIPGLVVMGPVLLYYRLTYHMPAPGWLYVIVISASALHSMAFAFWAEYTVLPIVRVRNASAALRERLRAERYVVTDRAVYAVESTPTGCSWERVRFEGAKVRREPLDANVPDVASIVVEAADGRSLNLSAPEPSGMVAGRLDALTA